MQKDPQHEEFHEVSGLAQDQISEVQALFGDRNVQPSGARSQQSLRPRPGEGVRRKAGDHRHPQNGRKPREDLPAAIHKRVESRGMSVSKYRFFPPAAHLSRIASVLSFRLCTRTASCFLKNTPRGSSAPRRGCWKSVRMRYPVPIRGWGGTVPPSGTRSIFVERYRVSPI